MSSARSARGFSLRRRPTVCMSLTGAERARDWRVFTCPRHGDLVATRPGALVICRCGRRARPQMSTSERVLELRRDGFVPAAIADELQLSDARVQRILREAA